MSKLIDITGQRFGFWVVQKRSDNTKSGQVQWQCLCDCGTVKNITANSLRIGNSTSCGCNHTPDLSNMIFGQLQVIKLNSSNDKNRRYWSCQCHCGKIIVVSTYKLREGLVDSCGHDRTSLSKRMNKTTELINTYIGLHKLCIEQNEIHIKQNEMNIQQITLFIKHMKNLNKKINIGQ